MEHKELDAITQVRDAVQMAENAVLEKEQVFNISFLHWIVLYNYSS